MKTVGKILLWCLLPAACLLLQFTPLMVFVILPFACLAVKKNVTLATSVYLLVFAVCWAVTHFVQASVAGLPPETEYVTVMWACVCLLPMWTLTGVLKAKRGWRNSILSVALAYVLGFIGAAVAVRLITGEMPVVWFVGKLHALIRQGTVGETVHTLRDAALCLRDLMLRTWEFAALLLKGEATEELLAAMGQPLSADRVTELADAWAESYQYTLNVQLPYTVLFWSLAGGAATWLTGLAVLRRQGANVAPMPSLARWSLSRKLALGLCAVTLLAYGAAFLEVQGMEALFYTTMQLLMLLLTVQGLAFFSYMAGRWKMSRWLLWTAGISVYLFMPRILSMVGMFELLFSVRKFMEFRDQHKDKS